MKVRYVTAIYLMRWLTDFYDFSFKWTATTGIIIHPTKAWLSQLVIFKNAIWTRGHFRRTICNKNLDMQTLNDMQFKLGKNATETYGIHQTSFWPSCMNQASAFEWYKKFSLWGMMTGVRGVRKSIDQSWWAKGLGLGLVCWGFKGIQEEIPLEEANTLQIGSVAFPPG